MSYQSKYTGKQVEDALGKAITAVQPNDLNKKQDTIADLEEIRSGAAKGATAVQDSKLAEVVKSLNDSLQLSNEEIAKKYGVIRMSKDYDSEGYYSLELFSTKEDEALYDSNNDEYESLVTKVKIPISVSPSNYQAELSTPTDGDVNIVFSGEELNIPFVFRAIKVTLVGNENTSYKGILIIESSSDGVTWSERGRASNSLSSADIDDNTTISLVNIGKYLIVGKQQVRARAAFSFQDNIIESDNVVIGTITKTTAENSSLVLQGIYESGIIPDEIHFHDVKWNISAELMMWMADVQVSDITGTIDIEGSILFNDKNKLLARYGNVDDSSSNEHKGLKLNYSKTAFDASTAKIKGNFFVDDLIWYNSGYNTEEEFIFEVQPGSDSQNTQTNITYSVEGSGNYTMDADGTFRVKMYELSKMEQTAIVKADISVIKNGASVVESVSKEIEVWLRPAKVGDLVYYDGTFSSSESYDGEKTVVGACCYVAPRKADGSINEKFHNPLDKHTRLMVSKESMIQASSDSEHFRAWQWGAYYNANGLDESLYSIAQDGTKKELSLDGVTTIYDVPNLRNIRYRGLYLSDGTTDTDRIIDESMRDDSDLGLENNGFKPISAETSMGDGFAYNEPLDYQNERKIDDTLLRLVGEGYAKGDMVNSGYAKTLRVIAHRNNIINHCYKGNTINGMSIPLSPVSASDGDSEIDVLAQRMTDLRNWAKGTGTGQLGDTQYGDKWSQLYYPAASACYAYEPSVANAGEILSSKFKRHNWFLPTAGLLGRLLWYMYEDVNGKGVPREDSPFSDAIKKGELAIIYNGYHFTVTEMGMHEAREIRITNLSESFTQKRYPLTIRAVCAF